MLGIHDFSTFIIAAILLSLTPGPDTLLILGRSISQGTHAGIASVLGISVGFEPLPKIALPPLFNNPYIVSNFF